jgi:catechol 2,3-dioxygenase-like lactoylglutathione lyase family enzyme
VEAVPKLRVARASDDLDALIPHYGAGFGLNVLYRFENHDGFDGVTLGLEGAPYHFEFTRARGHVAGRAPTKDNLLVFYMPDPAEWSAAVARMRKAGFDPVRLSNSYWNRNGCTFEDRDGYRIVIHKASWGL